MGLMEFWGQAVSRHVVNCRSCQPFPLRMLELIGPLLMVLICRCYRDLGPVIYTEPVQSNCNYTQKVVYEGAKRYLLAIIFWGLDVVLYIGQLAVGFTITWSGPNIPKLQDLETSPLPYILSETQASLVGSLLYIGALPGPFLMGWLSNLRGRKPCLVLGGIFGVIGFTLLGISNNLAMLYCGRMMSGMGSGCLAVMNLVYIGEIASTNIRGILLTVLGIFTTSGGLMLFSLGSFLSYHETIYVGLALYSIFTLYSFMIPETPVYHVLKDNDDALKKVLQDLGRMEDLNKFIESKNKYRSISNTKNWRDLFTLRSNKKALFIVLSVNVFEHCSGVMSIRFFSSTIFETAGSSINGNIAMIVIASFQLIGSGITPIFIERIGRKILLSISCMMCFLCMIIMGLYFYLVQIGNPVIDNIKWLPLAVLIVFFISYDSGLGIVPSVLVGEMFTPNTRTNGSAVAISSSWVSGFLVNTAFGALVSKVGVYVPFWFFAANCILAFFFTVFIIPETKGKSLLEIQEDLGK